MVVFPAPDGAEKMMHLPVCAVPSTVPKGTYFTELIIGNCESNEIVESEHRFYVFGKGCDLLKLHFGSVPC